MKRVFYAFCVANLLLALAAAGCSDDDSNPSNNNINDNVNNNNNNNNTNTNTNTNDDTIYQLQDEDDPDFIPDEAECMLENVIVTAVDNYGEYTGNVFVQEVAGGPFSGVLVYAPQFSGGTTIESLMPGDLVNVEGVKDEFAIDDRTGRTMTEVSQATLEVLAQGEELDPETVASAEHIMNDPGGESYEGVLVLVENVRAIEINQYDEVEFSGGLVVGDDLMDVVSEVEVGTCYSAVVGVLGYFYKYTLHPRQAADFVIAANDSDCPVGIETECDDDLDNDDDGFTDCQDHDCYDDPVCVEADCSNGQDDDGDGYTDCADRDCKGTGDCAENTPTLCDDGVDNNGDGRTDCDDPACALQPAVLAAGTCDQEETGAAECGDATDNDSDGFTDCEDFSCRFNPDVIHDVCEDEYEDTTAECTNGIDEDGNSYTDCNDWSCQHAGVCVDVESTDSECSDGTDNDGDMFADCEDWSCQDSMVVTVCEGNILTCSDDLDNDGNGYVDCDDLACKYCDCDDPDNHNVSPVCPPCECP